MNRPLRLLPLLAPLLLLAGCDGAGVQSVLDPASPQADRIDIVWRLMLWVCGAFYLMVLGFLAVAVLRHRRRRRAEGEPPEPHPGREGGLRAALAGWVGLIALGLLTLIAASYVVDRRLAHASGKQGLNVQVTAHQWWWEVEYLDEDPSKRFKTANELRLPAGVPVRIELRSSDVIHSFWVPNLHGKLDLIPGRANEIHLIPERTGRFRGQCAEFCGLQHAHMAFDVTVEERGAFEAWRAHQVTTAAEPATELARKGREHFETSHCAMCHAIRGTKAAGSVAPDLTHLAGRATIAAGALPNTRGNLAAWIADPQGIKPGSRMPFIGLEPDELDALTAYLETLR